MGWEYRRLWFDFNDIQSLNPCFVGIWVGREVDATSTTAQAESLNPCFVGIWVGSLAITLVLTLKKEKS